MSTQPRVEKVDLRRNDYTSHSKTYDEERFAGKQNEYLESIRLRAVLNQIGRGEPSRRVVDVGCGTGRGLLALGLSGFSDLTGLDYTQSMLERAREKLDERLPDHPVRLTRGDAFALPFPTESFDVVISLNFFHMFQFDLQRELLREMRRVCRIGGRVVTEFESIHKGFFVTRYREQARLRGRTKFNSVQEISRLFSADEFENVRVLGAELPLAYRVCQHMPLVGRFIESITRCPPFNWLAARIVVGGRRR